MARLRPAMVAVIGTVLVLAGCGEEPRRAGGTPTSPGTGPRPATPPTTRRPARQPRPQAGRAVPEQLRFTARHVDGKEFSGESLGRQASAALVLGAVVPEVPGRGAGDRRGRAESPATCSSSASPRRTRCRRCRTSWTASTSARSRTSPTSTPPSGSGSVSPTSRPTRSSAPTATVEIETDQLAGPGAARPRSRALT